MSVLGGSIRGVTAPLSPDERQSLALDHVSGTLLVTGPAGTGKTTVLCERFARLVESGADPDRVALVVGSSSAREAARGALLGRLPTSLPGLHVVTMHGLANRILKARADDLGVAEPPQLLSATDQFAKVQELLMTQDPSDWPAYGSLLGMRGFADEVRQFVSRAQEALLTPEHIAEAADRRGLTGWHELARFLGEYQEVLDPMNASGAGPDTPAATRFLEVDGRVFPGFATPRREQAMQAFLRDPSYVGYGWQPHALRGRAPRGRQGDDAVRSRAGARVVVPADRRVPLRRVAAPHVRPAARGLRDTDEEPGTASTSPARWR